MKANKKLSTGLIKFTFEDEDGEVFSSFRMNPTDVNLMKRAMEVSDYFHKRGNEIGNDIDSVVDFNKELEEKINYLLGYDASSSIFGEITATTITPEGRIFAEIVFEFISEKLEPEIAKRKQNMQSKMDKYTEKYLK